MDASDKQALRQHVMRLNCRDPVCRKCRSLRHRKPRWPGSKVPPNAPTFALRSSASVTESTYLRPLSASSAEIGFKAAGLHRAAEAGVRVPEGFVIAASAFDDAVRRAGGPFTIPDHDPLPALMAAQRALHAVSLPPLLAEQLFEAGR